MILDRWVQVRIKRDDSELFGNVLLGEVWDHPQFPNRTRVKTGAILFVDPVNFIAETKSDPYDPDNPIEYWDLKTPGTIEEYQTEQKLDPLKRDPESGLVLLDQSQFLRPTG